MTRSSHSGAAAPAASPSSNITFEDIYRAYGERILNLAYRMTGQEETARDLTHDVFVKVYEKLETFQGKSQVYTWIYRIAVNHILNYLKRARRQAWLSLLDRSVGEVLREAPDASPEWMSGAPLSPDRALERRQREEVVWGMICQLPPKYRVPLVLFRYEGLSYKEIAETLGLSLAAVETRIHRAKKQLAKQLEPYAKDL